MEGAASKPDRISALRKPLGDSQRWATVALQYLREMDLISTRRAEVSKTGSGGSGNPDSGNPPNPSGGNAQAKPNPNPKKKGGKGRGKKQGAEQEDENQ